MEQPLEISIDDIREIADFKTSSFTGFRKTEVKNKILQCLANNKIEEICYWTAEFVAAGHFAELWEICFFFLGKYIHLGNPLMTLFIQKKYETFRQTANSQLYRQHPLYLRNNETIRELFAELFCTMTLSDKKNSYEEVKIHEVADISHIVHHLRADHSHYADPIMRPEDPKEWTIAINELGYHISNEGGLNMSFACFWVEWLIEFDALSKKRKQILQCERRTEYAEEVEGKYCGEFIWVVWDTILYYAKERGALETILISALFNLFRIRYNTAAIKKRKSLLYFAMSILTESNTQLKRDILPESSKQVISVAVQNIHNVIYRQLKTHEMLEKSEMVDFAKYEKNKHLLESVQKLRLMNQNHFLSTTSKPL